MLVGGLRETFSHLDGALDMHLISNDVAHSRGQCFIGKPKSAEKSRA